MQTLTCNNCRGPIEVDSRGIWQTCPYCGDDNAVPMTFHEAGEVADDLADVRRQFEEELADVQQRAQRAARTGSDEALRTRVEAWVDLEFDIYRRAGVLEDLTGAGSTEAVQQVRSRQVDARIEQLRHAVGGPESDAGPNEAEQEAIEAYQQAIRRQNPDDFVETYRRYLTLQYQRRPETDDYSKRQLNELIDEAIGQALRQYDWVSADDLERLGFDDNAPTRTETGMSFDCRHCGASFEVDGARERVECPYCGAEMHAQATGSEATEAFEAGFGGGAPSEISTNPSGPGRPGDDTETQSADILDELDSMIEQSREMWRDSYPNVEPDTDRGRALTYHFLSEAFGYTVDETQLEALREAFELTEPSSCETCGQTHVVPTPSGPCLFME